MQTRPSITYQSLKDIMTRTVKRGTLRSFLGDRDHTTRINELLDHYITIQTSERSHLPAKIDYFSELSTILAFHQFTIQFNEIMQGPLEGKSSVAAARAVETAINRSQQKYLADAWSPFSDLFNEDYFNSLQIKGMDYLHYQHYLIPFIKTIITPNDSFDLNQFLQTVDRNAYQFLRVVFTIMNRPHLENTDSINASITQIQEARQANLEITHTLKLAEFFNTFRSILESSTVKKLNFQLGSSQDEIGFEQCIQWLKVMYHEVHPYFDASNQHIYQEAMQHYLTAAIRFRTDIYSELITPEFFKLDRMIKLQSLLPIVTANQSTERTRWAIEAAYYIHFKFFNKNISDSAFLLTDDNVPTDDFFYGNNWLPSSLSLQENDDPNLPLRRQSLVKNPDDLIDFLDSFVNQGLAFIAMQFLGAFIRSDLNAGLLLSQARHKRMIKASEDKAYQPALFGDILTCPLFSIAYGYGEANFVFKTYQQPSLFFSTLTQLSKIRGLLTEAILRAVTLNHSIKDTSRQEFMKEVNTMLTQKGAIDHPLTPSIIHHLFSLATINNIERMVFLPRLIIQLNHFNFPLTTNAHLNALAHVCGFNLETNQYTHLNKSRKLLELIIRLDSVCTTLIMERLFHHYSTNNQSQAWALIDAVDIFSYYWPAFMTEENTKSLLACGSSIEFAVTVFHRLTPANQLRFTPTLPLDHPDQPNAVFLRMTQNLGVIREVFIINDLSSFLEYIPEHIRSPVLLATIINLALNHEYAQAEQLIRAEINRILPRDEPQQVAQGQPFNHSQSTHTQSVHKTVSKSAIRLKAYFGDRVDIIGNLEQLEAELRDHVEGTQQFKNDTNPELRQGSLRYYAAHSAVIRIQTSSIGEFQDPKSKMTTRELLAIAYESLRTPDIRTFTHSDGSYDIADESEARERLYDKLYEGERNYNLDANDIDDGKLPSRPACPPGMFNKVMEAMYTVVNCVKINMITKEYAFKRLQHLINKTVMATLKAQPRESNEEKSELRALLKTLQEEGASHLSTLILDTICKIYTPEFSALYQNDAGIINHERIKYDVKGGIDAIDIDLLLVDFDQYLNTPSIVSISLFQPPATTSAPEAKSQSENQPSSSS